LDAIEERMTAVGIHPDIAGFQDLAHAFDLKSSALAARATMVAALERRETRGCHNRSDYPDLDPAFRVNLVWSPATGVVHEEIPPVPAEISELITEVSSVGKLVE
jgi:succinate dehydrogenase / fumarate reductase flavoprotein subunit